MRAVDLIEQKRDGGEHTPQEIAWLIDGYCRGVVAPEQMSSWAMAVLFRGLTDIETHALTAAMVDSGETIDLAPLGRRIVDKHSTGGVGDKTTLAIAPICAAIDVPVAKMSGRGLAHTGGTLDKLESVPGFRIGLSTRELIEQVTRVGCAVIAQSDGLVPADRLLYALRDVTGTVPAPGLIAASVMSKKLAAGADAILLDVKVGEGAFMPHRVAAEELARLMIAIGEQAGKPTVCEISAMDEPLGDAVGNALEVVEAIACVHGAAPADLQELVLRSVGEMSALSDLGCDAAEGRARARRAIASGAAARAMERWIEAQGGDPKLVEHPWDVLGRAPELIEVHALADGTIERCSALAIGRAAMRLGAGRERKEDAIDHAVGIVVHAKAGMRVAAGDVLATVHARGEVDVAGVRAAFALRS